MNRMAKLLGYNVDSHMLNLKTLERHQRVYLNK